MMSLWFSEEIDVLLQKIIFPSNSDKTSTFLLPRLSWNFQRRRVTKMILRHRLLVVTYICRDRVFSQIFLTL